MIRKLKGDKANTCYVPFTGAFVKRAGSSETEMRFEKREADNPLDSARVSRYFNYLGLIGAHPKQILNENNPVLITEMIKGGNGLSSFLSLWLNQLNDIEKEAVKFLLHTHIFDTNSRYNLDFLSVGSSENIRLKRVFLEREQAEIIEGITPLNIAVPLSSRLVPMYRLSPRHKDVGLEIIPNHNKRREIKLALHETVQRRFQQS